MDKAKKAKLAELRKKKSDQKQQTELQRHQELVDAFNGLRTLFDERNKEDAKSSDLLLKKLSELGDFKTELSAVKEAIENLPTVDNIKISNLSEIASLQKEVDLTEVKQAIDRLASSIAKQALDSVSITNKKPDEYIPMRRVVLKDGQLVFDDKPQVISVGGGGGGRSTVSTVQQDLIRNGNSIAVVNPDGTPLSGGGASSLYISNIDKTTTPNVVYIGEAIPGSVAVDEAWRVTRIDKTTSPVTIRYAGVLFNETFNNLPSKDYI